MTTLEALDMVEDRLQHVAASVPVHVQIKQMIASVRQEVEKEEAPDKKPEKSKRK